MTAPCVPFGPFAPAARLIAAGLVSFATLTSAVHAAEPPPAAAPEARPALRDQLKAMKQKFEASAPPEVVRIHEEGIRAVAASGVIDSALREGAAAPDFTLPDASSRPVTLSELLRSGPVVLTWYRGGWCPYCNIQLHEYQESLDQIRAAGGQLVAISPELPDNSLSTAEKHALEFTVLSDAGNQVARRYGLVYRMPDEVVGSLKGRLDLPARNGDDSWELPLAVTYVVGKDGRIAFAFIDSDYRNRAEPADIIAALEKLRR